MSLDKRRAVWQNPLNASAVYERVVRSEKELQAAITAFTTGLDASVAVTAQRLRRRRIKLADNFKITKPIKIPYVMSYCEFDFNGFSISTETAFNLFEVSAYGLTITNCLLAEGVAFIDAFIKFVSEVVTISGTPVTLSNNFVTISDCLITGSIDHVVDVNGFQIGILVKDSQIRTDDEWITGVGSGFITARIINTLCEPGSGTTLVNTSSSILTMTASTCNRNITCGTAYLSNCTVSSTRTLSMSSGGSLVNNRLGPVVVTGQRVPIIGNIMNGQTITTNGGAGSNTIVGNTQCGVITSHGSDQVANNT